MVALESLQMLQLQHSLIDILNTGLSHIDLENSRWWKSCFQRMGFVRRAAKTGKVPTSKEL